MKARRTHGVANDHEFHPSIQTNQPMQAVATHTGWRQPPRLRVVYPTDIAETWSAVEDLWLRLARHPAMHSAVVTDSATGEYLMLFRIDGKDVDGKISQDGMDWNRTEARALLNAAADHGSYAWSQDGSHGNLAADIYWIGNTLVIELTRKERMFRWPEGESLVWAVQALLTRMQNSGGAHAH